MKRGLIIKKYRNIGFSTDNKGQDFIINKFDLDGIFGGVITLIGPNNSGKSNYLDALQGFYNNNIDRNRDITTVRFIYDNLNDTNPELIYYYYNRGKKYIRNVNLNDTSDSVLSHDNNDNLDSEIKIEDLFQKDTGLTFDNNIITYKEEAISAYNLCSRYDNLEQNKFFNLFFGIINYKVSDIKRAWEDSTLRGLNNLSGLGDELNRKIRSLINPKFNQLYFVNKENERNDEAYSFKIKLERNEILLNIYKGRNIVMLDYQSTGFRWFFNFFFNVLASKDIKSGDIVILDEPATNLHVKGQIELRNFLEDLSFKKGITFVIATHSPFLIDLDYLDELRIIKNKDGQAEIINHFHAVDHEDPDTLKPIKEALTVENNVLLNYDQKVIFVEGITDYNYYVGFKKYLTTINHRQDIERITFLPINGLGSIGQEKEIIDRLITIRKNGVLLCDGDKAGESIYENARNTSLHVIPLNEICPNFKDIESLFSERDKTQLGIKKSNDINKNSCLSSQIKMKLSTFPKVQNGVNTAKYTPDEQTINNFTAVFDFLVKDSDKKQNS